VLGLAKGVSVKVALESIGRRKAAELVVDAVQAAKDVVVQRKVMKLLNGSSRRELAGHFVKFDAVDGGREVRQRLAVAREEEGTELAGEEDMEAGALIHRKIGDVAVEVGELSENGKVAVITICTFFARSVREEVVLREGFGDGRTASSRGCRGEEKRHRQRVSGRKGGKRVKISLVPRGKNEATTSLTPPTNSQS
jgi:hypothetical protein